MRAAGGKVKPRMAPDGPDAAGGGKGRKSAGQPSFQAAHTSATIGIMDTDVLIVGAGPTGLMLANQLGRRAIRFEIIDRHSGPAQQSRAMAVHARTLEIYAKLGIAEQAVARGARGTGASMWANGRWRAQIPIGDIGTGLSAFPFVLMLG